ncbi:hypothetical protein FRC02_009649 [Tulasnella sp. 418]|nr:hypothetical protein FRC02_009649 [Tulasnella sp. 418]
MLTAPLPRAPDMNGPHSTHPAGSAEYYASLPSYIPPVSFDAGIPSFPSRSGTSTPGSSGTNTPPNEMFNPYQQDPWSTEQNKSVKVERTFSPGPEKKRTGRYAQPVPARSAGARKIGFATPEMSSLSSHGPSTRSQKVAMARAAVPPESFADSIARLNMALAARTANLPPKPSGPQKKGRKQAAPVLQAPPGQIYFPPLRKPAPPFHRESAKSPATPQNHQQQKQQQQQPSQPPAGSYTPVTQNEEPATAEVAPALERESAHGPTPEPASVVFPHEETPPPSRPASRPASMILPQTIEPPRTRAASFSAPSSKTNRPRLSSIITSFPSHSLTWNIERPEPPKRANQTNAGRRLSKTPSESDATRRRRQSSVSSIFNPYKAGNKVAPGPRPGDSMIDLTNTPGRLTSSPPSDVKELNPTTPDKTDKVDIKERRKSIFGRILRKKTDEGSPKSKVGSDSKEAKDKDKEKDKEGSFHQLFGAWNGSSPVISRNSTLSVSTSESGTRSKRSSFFAFSSTRTSPTSETRKTTT